MGAFRITNDDIAIMRELVGDEPIVDAYAQWVNRAEQLDLLVHSIEEAFAGVTLGDGIGLREAEGIDDYASEDELAKLRSRDEHADWRRIDTETLNDCYSAPSFMDARGFVFHLPAFLTAELNDKYHNAFIRALVYPELSSPSGWIELLTPAQRDVVADVLSLVRDHPDYCDFCDEFEIAVERLRESTE